jgi:hypothetical protein
MEKRIFRLVLNSAGTAMLALSLAFGSSAFPKTASCPIEAPPTTPSVTSPVIRHATPYRVEWNRIVPLWTQSLG